MNNLLKTCIILLLITTGCRTAQTTRSASREQAYGDLNSGEFRLVSVNNGQTCYTPDRREITLHLNLQEKTAAGFAGCNRFSGSFVLQRDTIIIGLLVSTKMACPDLQTEGIYLGSLSGQSHRLAVTGDTLRFSNKTSTLLFTKISK